MYYNSLETPGSNAGSIRMTLIVNRLKNKLSDAAFVASSSEGSEIGLLPEDETQMLNDLANEATELENEERSARTRYR